MAGNKLKSKQIDKVMACPIIIAGFTTTNGNTSDVVTAEVTTALATAGAGGSSVPLVVSPNDLTQGMITVPPNNRVEIWDDSTQLKIQDGSGNEVYGRITEAAGVYTLSYYSLVAGTETAFTFDGRDIKYTINYRFNFDKYPGDCGTLINSVNIDDDPNSNGRCVCEVLAVTALNTVSSLSFTPTSNPCFEFAVNGQQFLEGGSSPFSVTGTAVTWTPGPYDLETTDCVEVCYFTHDGT